MVGRFEHLGLLAALHGRGDVYAVVIGQEIQRRTGVRPRNADATAMRR
ncbi:MAG TPA: hypothetical protein VN650_09035 [Gemmatimonadaceae bacterium]|nr:hypothetical protein [Gemmatimonadaceae bacterium]